MIVDIRDPFVEDKTGRCVAVPCHCSWVSCKSASVVPFAANEDTERWAVRSTGDVELLEGVANFREFVLDDEVVLSLQNVIGVVNRYNITRNLTISDEPY